MLKDQAGKNRFWITVAERFKDGKLPDETRRHISHRHGHIDMYFRNKIFFLQPTSLIQLPPEGRISSSRMDNPAAMACPPNLVKKCFTSVMDSYI